MTATDTNLLGRVGVCFPTRGGWRVAQLRWKAVVAGRTVTRREKFDKLTANCGARAFDRLKNEAKEAARHKTERLRNGTDETDTPPDKTLQAATLDYLSVMEGTVAESTIDAYTRTLEGFCGFLRDLWPQQHADPPPATVRAVTLAHTDAYMGWRRTDGNGQAVRMDSTLRNDMIRLARFFDRAEALGWRDAPLACVSDTLKPPDQGPAQVDNERIFAALADADPLRRVALAILAATGMRSGELERMTRAAWDPATRTLQVPPSAERTKRSKRTTGLGVFVAGLLDAWLAEHPAGPDEPLLPGIGGGRLGRWAGTHGLTPKQFRQWFISTLERWEDPICPDRIINKLAGHKGGRGVGDARKHYSFGVDGRPWIERVDGLLASAASAASRVE